MTQQLAPKLRFPEFTDEWQVKKLGDFSVTFSGGTPTSSKKLFYDGNIPFIKSGEISSYKTAQRISEDALKKSSAKLVEKGDILYALYGATSGQVAISNLEGAINQAILCIRPEANRYFIYSKLAADKTKILNTFLQGGQGNLSAEIIKKLPIGLPRQDEQQKIADFLTTVDKKIASIDKKVELLKQYKKGIMQKIFTQQIRFKDENGKEYSDWTDGNLGQVLEFARNGLSLDQNSQERGYKVSRIETISEDRINLKKVGYLDTQTNIEEYKLSKGDLLFSNINSPAQIGRVVYVDQNYDLYHGMNLLCLRTANTDSSKYIYYLLSSRKYKQYFESICNKAVNQASINQTDLKKTKIKIPAKPEQQKIADFLSTIDDKIKAEETKLSNAKKFKKALLQRTFA